jgi:tRNA isopentenyl-2-thiomethyl-A-37 hydroxylase MiaE
MDLRQQLADAYADLAATLQRVKALEEREQQLIEMNDQLKVRIHSFLNVMLSKND